MPTREQEINKDMKAGDMPGRSTDHNGVEGYGFDITKE
ncbi:unnamed protein product [Nezara viridula]|uniref:Uncharacterized protein n=1 Tax=Nezara viridula TaxID=85310 RepID=A0A9P0EAE2_NEZVI|nr:unnamed protein product [Nezara viridula]